MNFKCKSFSGEYVRKVRFEYLEYGATMSNAKRPLIVFLHGACERSNELKMLMESPFHELMEAMPVNAFKAIAPLCHQGTNWTKSLEELNEFIASYVEESNIDRNRIYLLGYSMGAFGVWHFSCAYPEIPAAVCVISGGADHGLGFPDKAASMKHIPIYAYHSQFDPIIPVEILLQLETIVKEAGGEIHTTIFPYNYHNILREVLMQENIIEKLLGHRKE